MQRGIPAMARSGGNTGREKAEKMHKSWNAARAIVQGQGRIDTKFCYY